MIDMSDPTLDERLQRRTSEGRYEISEIEVIQTIRALLAIGDSANMRRLSEVLLYRCAPMFQRHSQGLRHRPDLREEAIANMGEHLLREAQNPHEVFMTQNFVHYLRCLCADEFNRVLRQEGLFYRRDAEGRPSGRPQHVPRSLIELPVAKLSSSSQKPNSEEHQSTVSSAKRERCIMAVAAERGAERLRDPSSGRPPG